MARTYIREACNRRACKARRIRERAAMQIGALVRKTFLAHGGAP
eukprot:CAMPEP_0198545678 /NCGR_PEP_ID=MMETSP1462-20131121/64909_1 /TAXON_ID=1333877 /ORGANISM="Brandtodinium nutriculum, Strain RCC3387" /LENGTH=43 /DNA_ID= /DNA_START= /DNA_END= /DNA_ORIENTATION=